MATTCPKCGKGTLKKGEKMVYCSEYKPKKSGNEWVNEGTCDFRIMYRNSAWKQDLTPGEIKKLVDGETLVNKRGDRMVLDLNSPYYTKIEFAPKEEDEDL
jgi:hypothetical protein